MPARPSPSLVTSPTPATPSAAPLRAWMDAAAEQYRGRLAVIRAVILAALSPRPTNVLLLGPPGTAKTASAAEWCRATLSSLLAVTLSPWTDRAELEGPVDLKALADGRLERAASTRPTLATAHTIVLDELPRAAPGIRALLLSVLSDRRTPTWDAVPAHVVIATANTRLTSEEDQAMVDRFALTVDAGRLLNPVDLRAVIGREVPVDGVRPTAAPLPPLPAGLVEELRARTADVVMPGDVLDAVVKLCIALRSPSPSSTSYPDVSERRWILATRLLQASATLDDRTSVDWSDLVRTLPAVLHNGDPATHTAVTAAVEAAVPAWVSALSTLEGAINRAIERARRVGAVVDARPGEGDAHTKVVEELEGLADTLRPYGADVSARADALVETGLDAVKAAWIDGQTTYAAARKRAK